MRFVHIVILMLLVGLVFANVLTNGFVWDDAPYLLNIDAYRSLDFSRFFLGLGNGIEYLPIRDVSYALDFALWGVNSTGFHVTNVILYAIIVIVVYRFTYTAVTTLQPAEKHTETMAAESVSFWTAAFFALHPIHCETINFLGGGRNTLLAGLFVFLSARSFILFLGDTTDSYRKDLAFSLGWYICALLSKATAVSLPLFYVALCMLPLRRTMTAKIASTIPFIAASGAVFILYTSIATKTGALNPFIGAHMSLTGKLSVIAKIPYFYICKFILPTGLSVDYTLPSLSTLPTLTIAAIASLALIILTYRWRNRPCLYMGVCWYWIMLLPVMQLVPSPMPLADRYAYLPSFAFCFLAAYTLNRLGTSWPKCIQGILTLLLISYGLLSFQQNKTWNSNQTLWEQTLISSPNSMQALTNLGTYYYVAGNYPKAFQLLDRARRVNPSDPTYDFFMGHNYYFRNNIPAAVSSFEQALAKKFDLIDALFYMGEISERNGNREKAASFYQQVVVSIDLDRSNYKEKALERLQLLN